MARSSTVAGAHMTPDNFHVFGSRTGDDEPKRSLVLSGGGMRVSYQAGVIKALMDAGLTFFHGDGTSGGGMSLAMLFSGLSPDQMCDRWRSLRQLFRAAIPLLACLRLRCLVGVDPRGDVQRTISSVQLSVRPQYRPVAPPARVLLSRACQGQEQARMQAGDVERLRGLRG